MAAPELPGIGAIISYELVGPYGDKFPDTADGSYPALVIEENEKTQRVCVKVFTPYGDLLEFIPFKAFAPPEPEKPEEPAPEPVDPFADDIVPPESLLASRSRGSNELPPNG